MVRVTIRDHKVTRRVGARLALFLSCLGLLSFGGVVAGKRGPVKIRLLDRTVEPLMVSDRPWEAFTLDYVSVIKTGETWHLWYRSYDADYKLDSDSYLNYARSRDGIHWEKPELGLVPFKGNLQTNIVIDGRKISASATTVFRDEHAVPAERYKALLQKFMGFDAKDGLLWKQLVALSPDGLRWTVVPEPIYPWNSDTQNVAFWDKDRYRWYLRLWRSVDTTGKPLVGTESVHLGTRTIGLSESQTFKSFPKGEEILAPQGGYFICRVGKWTIRR